MHAGLLGQLRPLIHPMLVHFPIALIFASVALDWLGYLFKHANLTRAGFYTLVLGAMGAGLAALSGPDAATGDPSVPSLLASHQTFAALTVVLAVALVAVRFLSARGISGAGALAYLLATLFLVAFVSITGYYGGEMAYHHAVGISAPNVVPVSGAASVYVRPLLPAKPVTALVGFLAVVGLGFWLLLGRTVFPNAAGAWWQAVRQEWAVPSSPLWTLRRGPMQAVAAPASALGVTQVMPAAPGMQPAAYPATTGQGAQSAQAVGRAQGTQQPPMGRMPAAPQGMPGYSQPRYNPPYAPDNQPRR